MKITLSFNLLLGVLLAGSSVVADDASQIATGSKMIANPRHASAIPLGASATDAMSATTSNLNLTTAGSAANALPPLPLGVSELKFSEFFRQPVGPRGLESTDNHAEVRSEFATNTVSENWFALTVQTNRLINGRLETVCGRPQGEIVFVRIRASR